MGAGVNVVQQPGGLDVLQSSGSGSGSGIEVGLSAHPTNVDTTMAIIPRWIIHFRNCAIDRLELIVSDTSFVTGLLEAVAISVPR